jgi:hypothetical protein
MRHGHPVRWKTLRRHAAGQSEAKSGGCPPRGRPLKFGEDTKANVGGPAGPANFTHGWALAVDVADAMRLRVTAAWCPTPTTGGGGIWQAGQGPAADAQGNIYFMTSNGGHIKFLKPGPPGPDGKPRKLIDHTTDYNGTTDFAESFVRLHYSPPPRRRRGGRIETERLVYPVSRSGSSGKCAGG